MLSSLALTVALGSSAEAQQQTGAITGRATDTSGGALPGVTVSIASPNMIGGARTAVTDEQGIYRFTLLSGGNYTVSFVLPGFATLNIEGVNLNAGATATINGKMDVAALQESVTVTSQSPTIDLESANVAVNWDQQKLDDLPSSRSLTGLVSMIPGLYATSFDVGGSSFGTGSGPAARTFGRAGGGVVSYDGMIWDQTYGDFGTYEEAQITTAAKGADAMNPGVTMNLVLKSGSNSFKGVGSANYQSGDFQSDNITDDLLAKGYAPGVNKFTSYKDYYAEIGGPILKDRLWFYASHRDASSGNLIPGFVSLADREQVEFYTKLQDPTGKVTWQVTKSNKFEGMFQVGRKWQPYRTASRFVPLESTQNQDSWSLIGPSFKWLSVLSSRATFDASLQRGGYWWPDVPWTSDVRKSDLATTAVRGAFLETDRVPRRWQYGATYAYFANMWGKNHELKTGYLGWKNIEDTGNLGYPNQQQYRYRSLPGDVNCDEAHNYDGCFSRPDSVLVYDYPNTTGAGEWYNSLYLNDKITLSRKLTLNVGVRFDRYSSFLPEQGNDGSGPFATKNIFPAQDESNFPIYSSLVPRISAVYDLTGEGRVAVRASYGRYVGGSSGANANPGPGATDVNPNAIITKTYTRWDGSIPYVPVPANLTTTAGGGTNRTIDLDLKGPYVDEYTAGLDLGLSRVLTLQFNYVQEARRQQQQDHQPRVAVRGLHCHRHRHRPGPRQRHRHRRRQDAGGLLGAQHLPHVRTADRADHPGRTQRELSRVWHHAEQAAVGQLLVPGVVRRGLSRPRRSRAAQPQRGAVWAAGRRHRHQQLRVPGELVELLRAHQRQLPVALGHDVCHLAPQPERRAVLPRGADSRRQQHQHRRFEWNRRPAATSGRSCGTTSCRSASRRGATSRWKASIDLYNSLNTNTITAQTNRNGSTYLQPTTIIAPRIFRLGVRYRF